MGKLRKALASAGKASYKMFEDLGKGMTEVHEEPKKKGKKSTKTKKKKSLMEWAEEELTS
jgi:hypothetical protein